MAERMHAIRHWLTRLGELSAHPGAFGVLVLYAVLWSIFDRATLDWNAFATLAVWFMTLLIQRAEHRDTQAMQAKLDELLHAHGQANNALTKIDDQEPEDIARHRTTARALD
jgi:low affinity Fe/Cu permease